MANRVNININANDLTRRGLASVRNNVRRLNRQIDGMRPEIRVRLNAQDTRRDALRIRRLVDSLPNNVPIRIDLDVNNTRRNVARARAMIARLPSHVNVRMNLVDPGPGRIRRSMNRLGRTMLNTGRGPFRIAGALLGGIMQDGIGQGIAGAFKAAGPVGIAALLAIITGAVSVVAAALSGLLITALGLAFVGVGLISAFQSKKVKAQWKETLASLKKDFKEVGEPMIPVLDRALERLQKMGHEAAPILKKALEEAAPATDVFIKKIMEGFKSFGKNAFQPIMDAWNVFAPVFGGVWDKFMEDLGTAFARMADVVRKHPAEIALALDVIFGAVVLIIDIVRILTELWIAGMRTMASGVGVLLEAVIAFAATTMDMMGVVLHAMAEAFSEVPGLGGKLKAADKNFGEFRDSVVEKMGGMKDAAKNFGKELDSANRKRTLEADISVWEVQLRAARADLKKTTSQKAKAKVQANIDDLTAKLKRARGELAAINGRIARTYVYTDHIARYFTDNASKPFKKATGGVVGTAATGGVRSNMTLVGEQGPELVNLPPGSHVRSNGDSRRLAGMTSSPTATLEIKSSGRRADDMLLELLREAIHQRGGDPVRVLGGKG